jgi:hypothetical protein
VSPTHQKVVLLLNLQGGASGRTSTTAVAANPLFLRILFTASCFTLTPHPVFRTQPQCLSYFRAIHRLVVVRTGSRRTFFFKPAAALARPICQPLRTYYGADQSAIMGVASNVFPGSPYVIIKRAPHRRSSLKCRFVPTFRQTCLPSVTQGKTTHTVRTIVGRLIAWSRCHTGTIATPGLASRHP